MGQAVKNTHPHQWMKTLYFIDYIEYLSCKALLGSLVFNSSAKMLIRKSIKPDSYLWDGEPHFPENTIIR